MILSFIGNENLFNDIDAKFILSKFVEEKILNGVDCFLFGSKGTFNEIVLNVCKELKRVYSHIKIFVAYESIQNYKDNDKKIEDVQKIVYILDNVEVYDKKLKFYCNMIDSSNEIVFFLDKTEKDIEGNKAFCYAQAIKKQYLNLCRNKPDDLSYEELQMNRYFTFT